MKFVERTQVFSALEMDRAIPDIVCMEVAKLIDEGYDLIFIRGQATVMDEEDKG